MADWDADSEPLRQNLTIAFRLARDAARLRTAPGVALARVWHRRMMTGLDVPRPAQVARFRGEAGLERSEVRVGPSYGTASDQVAAELAAFERKLAAAVGALDGVIPPGTIPATTDDVNAVIELCAWAHAEWVRIHPFANGNGRTARLWAAYIAMRYGLPPFVTLRPRPDGGYGQACAKAMKGDWQATVPVFRQMYLETLRDLQGG